MLSPEVDDVDDDDVEKVKVNQNVSKPRDLIPDIADNLRDDINLVSKLIELRQLLLLRGRECSLKRLRFGLPCF